MNIYQNAKIYTIRSLNSNLVYVGSTTKGLHVRFSKHLSSYKRYIKKNGSYLSSFDVISQGNAYIELYACYSCSSKQELRIYEGLIISTLTCVNRYVAGRSPEQYRRDNRIKKRAYNNTKVICECGISSTKSHIARHRSTNTHKEIMALKL